MPDPLSEPDASTAQDPDKARVLRGAPKGMRDVRLRHRAADGLPGRRTVPPSKAESGLVDHTDPRGVARGKVMTLSEAGKRAEGVDEAEAAKRSAVDLT